MASGPAFLHHGATQRNTGSQKTTQTYAGLHQVHVCKHAQTAHITDITELQKQDNRHNITQVVQKHITI